MNTFIQSLPKAYIDFFGIKYLESRVSGWIHLGLGQKFMRAKLDSLFMGDQGVVAPNLGFMVAKKTPKDLYGGRPRREYNCAPITETLPSKVAKKSKKEVCA